MNRIRYFLLLPLFAAAFATVSPACAGSQAEDASADWVVFESEPFNGESISLQLPQAFTGGNLFDPTVIAELQTRIAQCPDSGIASELEDALQEMRHAATEARMPLLLMLGPYDSQGRYPLVLVLRTPNPPWSESLSQYIENEVQTMGKSDTWSFEVERMNETVAYTEARLTGPVGALEGGAHLAYVYAPPYVYMIFYVPPTDYFYWNSPLGDAADASFDETFSASADTITVNVQ